jgi:ribosome-associated toxin RatA of RatAB toxin-antitoxin module
MRVAMTTVIKSAYVPFNPQQMFDLVNDIGCYPLFVPNCPKAEVLSRTDEHIEATVHFAKGPLSKSFTTLNRLWPAERIEMRLRQGPFRHLEGVWLFKPISNQGSQVTLNLSFEFNNKLLAMTLGPIFSQMTSNIIEAFTKRAYAVYAK